MRRWMIPVAAALVFAAVGARSADPRETPVVLAVRKAAPAVVSVSVEIGGEESPFAGFDPFFKRFFDEFFGEMPRGRRGSASGSGVVIDAGRHVLTNAHVVQNAVRIQVTLADGAVYDARLIGADGRTDLAVLEVDADEKLPFVTLGQSADLMIGETVIAIGNPFGLSHTVTTGVVSAVNRTIRGSDGRMYSDFIQTDASINPGNSGGPLLNILGEVVGINAAIRRDAEGIGFAIPADKARRIVADLLRYGEVHRAWLGLQVEEADADTSRHYGLKKAEGVLVHRVFSDSPAASAGVRRGDLLIEMDGRRIRSLDDYAERLAGYTSGSEIRLTLRGARGERKVKFRAGELEPRYALTLAEEWLGLAMKENDKESARRYDLSTARGLLVTEVGKKSIAAEAGIREGDVVRGVNDFTVDDREGFAKALLDASLKEKVILLVQRGRLAYSVSLSP